MRTENNLTWSVDQNDDKIIFRLAGELSRNTLSPLWKEWKAGRQRAFLSASQLAHRDINWDLAQISRIDSAGFALLCNVINDCRQKCSQGRRLTVEQAPSQLLTLADLFDLSDWLAPFLITK